MEEWGIKGLGGEEEGGVKRGTSRNEVIWSAILKVFERNITN